MSEERFFDWEDTIESDGEEWVVLPPGDYDFEVIGFERAHHPGSEKVPPCNKAILKIKLFGGDKGDTVVTYNLFLYSRMEWKLSEFFVAIGHKKKGEKYVMNFERAIGCTGRCKVGIRTWQNKEKGTSGESNEIQRFYEKQFKSWKGGGF